MKVLLISHNREEITMRSWPMGLASVAAATLEAGHDVRLLDLMPVDDPRGHVQEVVREFQPDLIGMSVRNIDDQNMEDPKFLLDQAKEAVEACRVGSDAPIVLGGPGYSMFPAAALEFLGADMGVQGEGEWAFPFLLDRIDRGGDLSEVPGLYLPESGLQEDRTFVKDLDRFPLPDVNLLSRSEHEDTEFWLPVQTRRGCAMHCSYCSTPTIEGRFYRRRSPEVVAQWLAECADSGFRRFFFVDNTFNLPPYYAKALCSKIAVAGPDMTWRCILYPKGIDEELVKLLTAAGCREVSLGFESGDDRILRGLNKRFDTRDIRRASQLLADHGIHTMGFLMLGGPGETEESAEESFAFVDSLNLAAVKITMGIRIYPDTELAKTAVDEGLIAPHDDLLLPRFYISRGLEDRLPAIIGRWMSDRPNWLR